MIRYWASILECSSHWFPSLQPSPMNSMPLAQKNSEVYPICAGLSTGGVISSSLVKAVILLRFRGCSFLVISKDTFSNIYPGPLLSHTFYNAP